MTKFILLLLCLSGSVIAQQKSTGNISIFSQIENQNALLSFNIVLNNATSTLTLTITGPHDRWFACKFGSFQSGMSDVANTDIAYYNGTTLIDARNSQNVFGVVNDAVQNWTVLSNTVIGTKRTIVATRPFITGDPNDYSINYNNPTIDLAGAYCDDLDIGYTLGYHYFNQNKAIDTPLATLGVEDFSLNASSIYPNPAQGNFWVKSKTEINGIGIYTQTGAFIKNLQINESDEPILVDIEGLQAGVYLIELANETEKSWKKLIIK